MYQPDNTLSDSKCKLCDVAVEDSAQETVPVDSISTGNLGPNNALEWSEPDPIQSELLPVESFNPEWLPEALKIWIMDIADRIRCPIDYLAIAAMVIYSSLVGKKIVIKPKRNDDWVVATNLWG